MTGPISRVFVFTPPGPNVARAYHYLLGGYESFNADREQAAPLLRAQVTLKSGRWPRAGRA